MPVIGVSLVEPSTKSKYVTPGHVANDAMLAQIVGSNITKAVAHICNETRRCPYSVGYFASCLPQEP